MGLCWIPTNLIKRQTAEIILSVLNFQGNRKSILLKELNSIFKSHCESGISFFGWNAERRQKETTSSKLKEMQMKFLAWSEY